MKRLRLFYRPTCPYCRKVMDFMDISGIKLTMINVSEREENMKELVSWGGKAQVPCLDIEGQALYESDDIIEWLKNENDLA